MRRVLPPIVAGLVVFALLSAARWILAPEPPEPAEPVPLRLADMLGCWELDGGDWVFTRDEAAGSTAAQVEADSTRIRLLTLPDRILLLPDTIDEWRREHVTYRAAPVAGSHDARLRNYLRWFLRADTLWLVWSDRSVRAGLALLARGDALEGVGRALIAPGSPGEEVLDGKITAGAWKVNCATGLRDMGRSGPRR